MSLAVLVAGLLTGLTLGVFGSGGSIVTVPALLYLVGVEPKPAIAMSLAIVALTATIAGLQHWWRGNVDLRVTAVFGGFGIAGTYAGALLGVVTPVVLQLGLFAAVMYVAAWKMFRPQASAVPQVGDGPRAKHARLRYGHIAVHGIGVGVLTGIVGVGGGFLIVPALVLLSGLPMKRAVGTSLTIIALKSYAGFAGYAGALAIDYGLILAFAAVAVLGSVAGAMLGHRVAGDALQRGFAVFLFLVATYIVAKSVF